MLKTPISIVINTYNAGEQIVPTLESVKDFDEVVVCDMESTDNTVEIAQQYGCRVVTFPKEGHNICEPARDFAIHSARNEWVLVVDADEVVPSSLKNILQEILHSPPLKEAYFIPRKNMFLGEFVKASFPDFQLRFLRQKKAVWPPTIHSLPMIDGEVGFLPKRVDIALVHSGLTVSSELKKIDVYSQNDLIKRKKDKVGLFELMLSPAYRFFRYYILHGACFQGKRGFIKACFSSHMKFYYLAKVYERQLKREGVKL
jgi:glycosyltransferase involved in cell wall biosynthesis